MRSRTTLKAVEILTTLAALVTVLGMAHMCSAMNPTSGSLIEAAMDEPFNVECPAYNNSAFLQSTYGKWSMERGKLERLQLDPFNAKTEQISCMFRRARATGSLYRSFNVYKASGMAVPCGPICLWTVHPDGFYLYDALNDLDGFMLEWMEEGVSPLATP